MGISLFVRVLDGDTAVMKNHESATSVLAATNFLRGFNGCAELMSNSKGVVTPFSMPNHKKVELGELARIVHKYLTEHPEEMHMSPEMLGWNALVNAFPNQQWKY